MMIDKTTIDAYLHDGDLAAAIKALDSNIAADPANSLWWYLRGRAYWRLDQRGRAISDYEEAAALDPDSPAVHALDFARGIMDFFNPDLLNP